MAKVNTLLTTCPSDSMPEQFTQTYQYVGFQTAYIPNTKIVNPVETTKNFAKVNCNPNFPEVYENAGTYTYYTGLFDQNRHDRAICKWIRPDSYYQDGKPSPAPLPKTIIDAQISPDVLKPLIEETKYDPEFYSKRAFKCCTGKYTNEETKYRCPRNMCGGNGAYSQSCNTFLKDYCKQGDNYMKLPECIDFINGDETYQQTIAREKCFNLAKDDQSFFSNPYCIKYCNNPNNKAECDAEVFERCKNTDNKDDYCRCFVPLTKIPEFKTLSPLYNGLTHCFDPVCRTKGYRSGSERECPAMCMQNLNIGGSDYNAEAIKQSCDMEMTGQSSGGSTSSSSSSTSSEATSGTSSEIPTDITSFDYWKKMMGITEDTPTKEPTSTTVIQTEAQYNFGAIIGWLLGIGIFMLVIYFLFFYNPLPPYQLISNQQQPQQIIYPLQQPAYQHQETLSQ